MYVSIYSYGFVSTVLAFYAVTSPRLNKAFVIASGTESWVRLPSGFRLFELKKARFGLFWCTLGCPEACYGPGSRTGN